MLCALCQSSNVRNALNKISQKRIGAMYSSFAVDDRYHMRKVFVHDDCMNENVFWNVWMCRVEFDWICPDVTLSKKGRRRPSAVRRLCLLRSIGKMSIFVGFVWMCRSAKRLTKPSGRSSTLSLKAIQKMPTSNPNGNPQLSEQFVIIDANIMKNAFCNCKKLLV